MSATVNVVILKHESIDNKDMMFLLPNLQIIFMD